MGLARRHAGAGRMHRTVGLISARSCGWGGNHLGRPGVLIGKSVPIVRFQVKDEAAAQAALPRYSSFREDTREEDAVNRKKRPRTFEMAMARMNMDPERPSFRNGQSRSTKSSSWKIWRSGIS